jgi:predicted AlkP superfamily pyrophosphatase or phosphodiesterase
MKDYTEVDNNVTRHVTKEMNRSDWDMMILHYLGVDHIGHLQGPQRYLSTDYRKYTPHLFLALLWVPN